MSTARVDKAFDTRVVIPSRVVNGLDRRTLLIIKHIPNKMTHAELELLVLQSHGCKHDSLVLPQDRRSHRNKGYAFIYLVAVDDVLNFWAQWQNGAWLQHPGSAKRCTIQYAKDRLPSSR